MNCNKEGARMFFFFLAAELYRSTQGHLNSEAWGPPQFQEKGSRSEKAIPGALVAFRGILGSNSRSSETNSRNEKSHSRNGVSRLQLCENHNSRSNSRSDSQNSCEPTRKIFICFCISERFFKNWGGPRTPDELTPRP